MITIGLICLNIACLLIGWQVRGVWKPKSRIQPWQIDPNQQCPGCGHSAGFIKFDENLRTIVHTCATCSATWGEETVVKVADWRKGRPPEENPTVWP